MLNRSKIINRIRNKLPIIKQQRNIDERHNIASMENIMEINIGGIKYHIEKATILKYADTRLGRLSFSSDEFIPEHGFFYFNRNPEMFQMILDFYRYDSIHIQSGLCTVLVEKELEFWEIPLDSIAECCRSKFLKSDNEMETINRIKAAFGRYGFKRMGFGENGKLGKTFFEKVWLFFEEPMSSKAAKIYNLFYLVIVLCSVVMVFILTFPDIRVPYDTVEGVRNKTKALGGQYVLNEDNPKEVMKVTTLPPNWWKTTDYAFLGFFTLEYVIRLLVSPNKKVFCSTFLNILDFFLNLSMWIRLCVEQINEKELILKYKSMEWMFSIAYCMISLRLLRIFRINKQYKELRVLILSLRSSSKELTLMLVIFLVLVALFANFIYYAEFLEPSTFPTTFSGLWWAVVTLTTVGFGDVVPKTSPGKLVGAMCAACGLIFLAMPIAIISSKFHEHYQAMKDIDHFKRRLSKTTDAIAVEQKEKLKESY